MRRVSAAPAVAPADAKETRPASEPSSKSYGDSAGLLPMEKAEISLAVIQRKLQEFAESSGHQTLLFFLAILAIAIYIAGTYVESAGLERCQFAISIFFVVEFFLQFAAADSKLEYLISWFGLVDICSALPIIHLINPNIDTLIVSLLRFCVVLRMSRVVLLFQIWSSQDNDVYREVVYLCFSIISFILFATGLIHWLDGEWRLFADAAHAAAGTQGDPIAFHEALYFVVVSISTVGYGDYVPDTAAGQLLTVLLLCAAITIFPLRAGRLIAALSQTTYSRASYSAHRRSAHVVVTGAFTGHELRHLAAELLRPVRASVGPDGEPLAPRRWLSRLYSRPLLGRLLSRLLAEGGGAGAGETRREAALHLVLLAPGDPPPDVLAFMQSQRHRGRVHYLAGSPLSAGDLRRAAVRKARAVFIVSRELGRDVYGADGANLLACVAVRQVAPATPIFLQHATSDLSGRAGRLGATVSVCLEDAKMRLLARSVVCPGLAALVSNISTQDRRVFLDQGAEQGAARAGSGAGDGEQEMERTSTLLQRRLVSIQSEAGEHHEYTLPEDVRARKSRFRHLSSFFMRKAEPAVAVSSPWQVEYDFGVANDFYTVPLGRPFEGLPWRRAALAAYDSHGVLLLGVQPAGGATGRRGRDFVAVPSERPCRPGDVALCLTISPRRAERLPGELAAAAGELLARLDAAAAAAAAPPAPPRRARRSRPRSGPRRGRGRRAGGGGAGAGGARGGAGGGGHVAVFGEVSPSGLASLVRCLRAELAAAGRPATPVLLAVTPASAEAAWLQLAPEERRALYAVPDTTGRGPYAMATLSRARARAASAVLVLAERRGRGELGEGVDTPAVLAALEAMAARRPAVTVDLVYDSNARFLNPGLAPDPGPHAPSQEAERHVRLCPAFAAGAVYSHAALYTLLCLCYHQGPACVAFLHHALESPRHLQQAALPAPFAQRSYRDLVAALLLCTPFVPLGLLRAPGTGGSSAPFVYTNPHPATRLLASDRVFLLRGRPAPPAASSDSEGPANALGPLHVDSPLRSPVSHTFDF
eukprot:tig00021537_g22281.t1